FLYILIPSYYTALLGRWLNTSTGIKYGIDYIDPWVHEFRGSNKTFSRHWISKKLAEIIDPIAIKNSSLITGVAEGYYKGVQERNIALKARCVFGAMPYGGEKTDHERVNLTSKAPYLFDKKNNKIQLVYAGAMLPKAYAPLERILKVLKENSDFLTNLELHFIGTGRSANDVKGYNIRPLAEKYGVWNTKVFEYPQRIPYFDVLIHLSASDGIFILGSTEPHYTPSKLFQAVLSSKPILAVLHKDSTGVEVLRKSNSGVCLDFNGEEGLDFIEENFLKVLKNYLISIETFDAAKVDRGIFEQYSARKVTETLAQLLNQVV
ncbi:MAG: hypothetical protein JWQ96_979, partial [Segetibacter sp.]|nr:hypothetical protein [Segetibacter sp.]